MSQSLSCYSMRRTPPYQGTVQLVEGVGFRAFSHDGIEWRVQMRSPGVRRLTQVRWSETDSDLVKTEATREVLDQLENAPKPPYTPADRLELWLLARIDSAPLALLRTITGDTPLQIEDLIWRPGTVDNVEFVSPSLGVPAAPRIDPESEPERFPHAEVLSRCIQAAADALPRAQWFRRHEDGCGTAVGGMHVDASLVGRILPRSAFPALLLREGWAQETCGRLVKEYHNWMSPSLLTHQDIDHALRSRLELAACRYAERLYVVRNLLPEVINKDRVDSALVEAVIRRSASI